jgi:UDP-N-acetyl-D-mannosaminuronic acid dehydrogenase
VSVKKTIKQKICILGLGYIGLPTASVLASSGFQVLGVDCKHTLVDTINRGLVHIHEPGLHTLVQAAVHSGNLVARFEPEPADVFLIAVPTPLRKEGDRVEVDLGNVEAAVKAVTPHLQKGNLVILESTSPPGTLEDLVAPLLEQGGLKAGSDFYAAYCPERVLPGRTMKELIENNRIIGGYDPASARKAEALYRHFVEGEIILTDARTAEMVKLAENIYRDVNVALANELSTICEKLGINAWEMIRLANLHPRVHLHQPGPGVGGHCISVDPWFVISRYPDESRMLSLARRINDERPVMVAELVVRLLEGIPDPVVTLMGVAYKGNIDDTRESPALRVLDELRGRGITCRIYDPHVLALSEETNNLAAAFSGSDCALLLADHDEFRYLYPRELGKIMRRRVVVDTRSCLERALWEEHGFTYHLLALGVERACR